MVVDYLSSQPNRAGYQVSTKQGSGPSLTCFFTTKGSSKLDTVVGKVVSELFFTTLKPQKNNFLGNGYRREVNQARDFLKVHARGNAHVHVLDSKKERQPHTTSNFERRNEYEFHMQNWTYRHLRLKP